jgi:hypothetical protein
MNLPHHHREYFTNAQGIAIAVRAHTVRSAIMQVTACDGTGTRCKTSDEYRQDVDYFKSTNWENLPERLTPDPNA